MWKQLSLLLLHGEFQLCCQAIKKNWTSYESIIWHSCCTIHLINSPSLMSENPGRWFKKTHKKEDNTVATVAVLFFSTLYIQWQQDHLTCRDSETSGLDVIWKIYMWIGRGQNSRKLCWEQTEFITGVFWFYHWIYLSCRLCKCWWCSDTPSMGIDKKWFSIWPLPLLFCPFSPSKLVQLHHT